jgi:hypothetical protein
MLQKASTHLIVPEPSEDLIANEPWSIEFYADGLMDELFADIDDILDVSGNLPSQTIRHGSRTPRHSVEETAAREWFYQSDNPRSLEYEPLRTVDVPQIIVPDALKQTVGGVPQVRNRQGSTVVVDTPAVTSGSKKRQKISRALGKLLMVGTTIGVAIAGIVYVVNSGFLTLLTNRLTQQHLYLSQSQLQLPTKVDIQAGLIDYMSSALAIIDKQQPQQSGYTRVANRVISNPTSVALGNNSPGANLLPPLAANNTPPAPNQSANVVERIYIPVYQAPSPMRYAPPPIPGIPSLLPPIPTNSQASLPNAVQKAAKPGSVNILAAVRSQLKPIAVQKAPITLRQPSIPLPALPVVPFGAAPSKQPTIPQAVPMSSVTTATPSHTLEGLLELGNKSAALFQVDGVSRRVNIGESIGSSGWTLVEVNNGEAIVRRNGEVRSIYTGQKL